jgi:hypothetical protein
LQVPVKGKAQTQKSDSSFESHVVNMN